MKKSLLLAALAALALPSLAACGSTGGEELAMAPPDMFPEQTDPSDGELQASIQNFLAEQKGPKNSQYEYARVDLNGDGLRDALVLFNLPHSYWCGWSGCTMAVFQAGDRNFKLLSQTTRIRGPLMVGGSQTDGWEDIGVRLTGTDMADQNVVLKFDGIGYPENPLNETVVPYDLASLGGTRLFP
ncbi:MAG: hypothetical protein DI551_09265 [Micavibrio aeruginosavorus]|uniref:Lipoprotein n=1 Tax=Micavibrio aeruginosavorus TaxID=349221 RepID=A0A2W5N204_9BACT|nr:MAG: hypothetical protein DI551_09265 [Micavibrio aeruginosavorus]